MLEGLVNNGVEVEGQLINILSNNLLSSFFKFSHSFKHIKLTFNQIAFIWRVIFQEFQICLMEKQLICLLNNLFFAFLLIFILYFFLFRIISFPLGNQFLCLNQTLVLLLHFLFSLFFFFGKLFLFLLFLFH